MLRTSSFEAHCTFFFLIFNRENKSRNKTYNIFTLSQLHIMNIICGFFTYKELETAKKGTEIIFEHKRKHFNLKLIIKCITSNIKTIMHPDFMFLSPLYIFVHKKCTEWTFFLVTECTHSYIFNNITNSDLWNWSLTQSTSWNEGGS